MEKNNQFQGEQVSAHMTLCTDGKYRWQYDVSLFKDLSIFFLVYKVLLFAFAPIFTFVLVIDTVQFGVTQERVLYNLKFLGYVLLGITVVTALGYIVYALIMGGKYSVIFEMDEHGINHKQIPAQAKKAKRIAKATTLAGAASGSLSTMGAGMAAARTEMYSDFSKVRRVKAYPRRHLIKVNNKLLHNQVYVYDEDFEFVKNYMISHCQNLAK